MKDLRVSFPKPCSEPWDAMRAAGCARHCASCDRVVHDLRQMTIDEIEALAAGGERVCVRAELNRTGEVRLKSAPRPFARRMIVAVSAAAGLVGAPAQASLGERHKGSIAGKLDGATCRTGVVAIGPDGRRYSATVGPTGRFKVKRLPDGVYELVAPSNIDDGEWTVGRAVVTGGKKTILNGDDPESCIIVGHLQIEGGKAAG